MSRKRVFISRPGLVNSSWARRRLNHQIRLKCRYFYAVEVATQKCKSICLDFGIFSNFMFYLGTQEKMSNVRMKSNSVIKFMNSFQKKCVIVPLCMHVREYHDKEFFFSLI